MNDAHFPQSNVVDAAFAGSVASAQHLKQITKRPKKTAPRQKAPPVTMGKDAKATDLTPVQAGTYAFIAEYVRNLTHSTWPQEPPVQAFIYPGRGVNDACRALHHM
jgi:hypothetical protein